MIKGFMRRFLPFVLSVAMTVEMLPATAFAAQIDIDMEEEWQTFEDTGSVSQLVTEIQADGFNQSVVPFKTGAYSGTAPFSETDLPAYAVYVNGDKKDITADKKWQKAVKNGEWVDLYPVDSENASAWTDMGVGESPVKAGKYLYVISVAAQTDVCEAASIKIPYEITKNKLTLVYEDPDRKITDASKLRALPGTKVSAFIEMVKNHISFQDEFGAKADSYFSAVNIIVNKKSGETLETVSADETFKSNVDYLYSIDPVLLDDKSADYQANDRDIDDYGLLNRAVIVSDAAPTKIEVTGKGSPDDFLMIDPDRQSYLDPFVTDKSYDKNPINIETDILSKVDVKTYYDADSIPETFPQWELIADDDNAATKNLTMQWWDAGCSSPLDEAPSEVGTYALSFSYVGKEGYYEPSEKTFIRVKITAQQVYIKPAELKKTFCTGMTVQDVTSKITYQVLYKSDNTELQIDKSTFFGVAVHNKDLGQAYAPLFGLMCAEKDPATGDWAKDGDNNIIYWPCQQSDKLDGEKKYIAVFTGDKAVFDMTGEAVEILPINEKSLNSASGNYEVLVDTPTLRANFIEIGVAKAVKTQVDVTAILEQGKGGTFADPIVRVYSGEKLLKDRSLYKKAVAKNAEDASAKDLAKDTDSKLSYRWQKIATVGTGENGELVPVYGDPEDQQIPTAAGSYRLEITYSDPSHVYADSVNYVYYEVQPLFVMLTPEGEYTAYSDTTVGEFLKRYQDKITFTINSVTGNAFKPSAAKGGEIDLAAESYQITWGVEYSTDNTNFTEAGEDDRFQMDRYYRLMAGISFDGNRYADHYVDYAGGVRTEYRFNIPVGITVKQMGSAVVTLEVNADKFTVDPETPGKTSKVYDGIPVTISNINELVTVKDGDGSVITGFPKDQIEISWNVKYNDGTTADVDAPVDSGIYTISAFFPGNETYKRVDTPDNDNTKQSICRITRRDLTITPVAGRAIKAGEHFVPKQDFPLERYQIEGAADADSQAFTYRTYRHYDVGYKGEADVTAIEAFVASYRYGPQYTPGFESAVISEKSDVAGTAKTDRQRYRSNVEYCAQTMAVKLADPYNNNYRVINAKAVVTAEQDGAQINDDDVHIRTTKKAGVVSIYPCEGLPYYQKGDLKDSSGTALAAGNYFTFVLQAPAEFDDPEDKGKGYNDLLNGKVLLKNAVVNAGGHVLNIDKEKGRIRLAFPCNENSANAKFEVVWQDNYTETFEVVLTGVLLCSDTSRAVLPKSLKFNGATTKMAVGQTQQLNVKVTKKQISDVIRIGYSVGNSEIISVTGNGAITALKPGKTTVSAYPIRIVDDKEEPIPGGKTAKVTIKVTDIAKPSITKVTALGNVVTVRYKEVASGYRREFYILEGKRTAEEFESKIASSEGEWKDIFAIAPVYGDGERQSGDKAGVLSRFLGNAYGDSSGSLECNKEYTVYVRNVSGVRTLHGGGMTVPSVAGKVKTFKTTKAVMSGLDISFDPKYEASGGIDYEVPLTEKYITASACGEFQEYHENPAAEPFDIIKKQLPLSKAEQAIYLNPKLAYYVTDAGKSFYEDAKLAKANGYTVKIGNKYFYPTKAATINKKGKLTLKGAGTVCIRAYDSANLIEAGVKVVKITANINAFSGKTGKTKVGQKFDLNTLLTYKADGKKVTGYPADFANPKVVLPESDGEDWSIDDDGMFIAHKQGRYQIKIADSVVEENGGTGETTVTVKVSALEPVKGLKRVFVYDAYAKIRFTYSSKAYFAGMSDGRNEQIAGIDFRVDIRDSAGRLVYSQFLDGENYVSEQGNVREYCYVIDRLSRRSSYKISVTAFCAAQESKAAKLSIKTTGVPTSYVDLDDVNAYVEDRDHVDGYELWYHKTKVANAFNGTYNVSGNFYDNNWNTPEWLPESKVTKDVYQGVHIETWGINEVKKHLDTQPFFTSGSTYILRPCEEDLGGVNASFLYPKEAKSDTMIWKVKDTKIATVKALQGSFSAKLKANKPGTTTLEVRSKNTKKVISRYTIRVKAVGDGHDYFGDYNDYYNEVKWDPTYEKSVEMLYVGNPLTIEQADREYVWVCYEAKEDGIHTFSRYAGSTPDTIMISTKAGTGKESGWDFNNLRAGVYLYAGTKLYMRVEGYIHHLNVACTQTTGMNPGGAVTISSPLSTTFSFTAPKDGCYKFSAASSTGLPVDFFDAQAYDALVKVNEKTPVTPLTLLTDYSVGEGEVDVLLKKGVTIRMKVKGTNETGGPYEIKVSERQYTPLSLDAAGTDVDLVRDEGQWFKFEAPESGEYYFVMSSVSGSGTGTETVAGYYYDSLDKWEDKFTKALGTKADRNVEKLKVALQEGDAVSLRLTASADTKKNIKVIAHQTMENDVQYIWDNAVNGRERWYTFEVPEDGIYGFRVEKLSDDGRDIYVGEYGSVGAAGDGSPRVTLDSTVRSSIVEHRTFAKGDQIIFKIKANDLAGENVKSVVSARISKCVFKEPEPDGSISFDSEGFAHYMIKAPDTAAAADYKILIKSGQGSFDIKEVHANDLKKTGTAVTGDFAINQVNTINLQPNKYAYFILQQTSTETASGTIAMVSEVQPDGKTSPAVLSYGEKETKWFYYNISKTGRYYIRSGRGGHYCDVSWCISTSASFVHGTDLGTGDILTAGEQVFIKVTNDETARESELDAGYAALKEINVSSSADGSAEVSSAWHGANSWCQVAAADAGLYLFDYTGDRPAKYYEPITSSTPGVYSGGTYIDELVSGQGQVMHMGAGGKLDLHLYGADSVADQIVVSKEIGTVVALTGLNNAVLTGNWYSYTIPTTEEDGVFVFTTTARSNDVSAKYYVRRADSSRETYFFAAGTSVSAGSSAATALSLRRGDTVLFNLNNGSNSIDVDMVISRTQITTIYAGEEKELTIKPGEPTYVQFKERPGTARDPYGRYFIKSKNHTSPDATYELRESGASVVFDTLPIGSKEIFTEMNASPDFDKVYEVVAAGISANVLCKLAVQRATTELSLTDVTQLYVEKGRYTYASFTVPDTDWYTFTKLTGSTNSVAVRGIPGNSYSSLTGAANTKEVKLTRGDKLFLKIDNGGGAENVTEQIAVERMPLIPIYVGDTGIFVPEKSAGESVSKWYAFTAGRTAQYTFKCTGTGLTFSLCNSYPSPEYSGITPHDRLTTSSGFNYYLARGETVYLRAENNKDSARAGSITIAQEMTNIIDEMDVTEGENQYIIGDGVEYIYFSFTPTRDGFYDFVLNGEESGLRYYPNGIRAMGDPEAPGAYSGYEAGDKQPPVTLPNDRMCNFIPEGKTVFLRNHKPFRADHKEITLTITYNDTKHRVVFEPYTADSEYVAWAKCPNEPGFDEFRLDVPAMGRYSFYIKSKGEPYAMVGLILWDQPGNPIKSWWGGNGQTSLLDVYLNEGESVYLATFPYEDITPFYEVYVKQIE